MATMFVRHTVSDYKAWRKVYDEVAPIQKRPGSGLAGRQHTLTAAAATAQPFDESGNRGARSYRQARQRLCCQQTDVAAA
jgi:hypothetical protein